MLGKFALSTFALLVTFVATQAASASHVFNFEMDTAVISGNTATFSLTQDGQTIEIMATGSGPLQLSNGNLGVFGDGGGARINTGESIEFSFVSSTNANWDTFTFTGVTGTETVGRSGTTAVKGMTSVNLAATVTPTFNPINFEDFFSVVGSANSNYGVKTIQLTATPEPGSVFLLGSALAAGAFWRRRRA